MIRHLRWKVVATNMLLISLVLLAVFAAVFFISRDNYRKNVQQQLYQALEQGDYGISQPGVDSIPCFVAEVYGSGTVRVAGNSYYDLSDETRLADIVTAALHRTADSGTLDEYHLRYLRQTGYATTAIAFTDTYLEYTSLRTLLSACSLVEDMLTLFRAQKSAGTLPDTAADVSEMAVTAALRFEPVAFEAGHLLEYDIAPGLSVRGDGAKLGQALAVLLDNAVKYAAPGTPIQLDAVRQGSRAVLTVTNQGEDIPADKLSHIFDRFYRADEARTDGSSFGLGLAIAKAIVDAHRGTIRCESGGGVTRFIISLPLAAGKQERGTDHV